ncbi:rod shape-determining protein MreC [Aphanothece hegewaldii CCALA 016]|uniref:Cell shape-determining protein MreC n=1 Tax=Aphanothece hegewaldii CCALA 016 TaxID=2107694 RepID=A0A2T1LY86_9CHRO|nr:rod shape-determining protein MreC [Aphanothece hegewaldii]PSF37350.1 rod shape-determining protein MreC [Aphanothece hegewaldii CCALA 016]
MFTVRRKWTQHGLQIVLVSLAIFIAWLVRQTQGGAVLELYAILSRPFHSDSALIKEQQLTDRRVWELEQRLKDVEQQNQQLKTLVKYFEAQKKPVVTAPVIGRSADEWWQQIIIGRGSQDGIAVGAAVTGIGGLVGRVVETTPNTSRILLISNPSSRVGASVSRSRSMGRIQGQGSQVAVMQFFVKVPDVKPGDVITTSTVSRLFPAGIPIGRVQKVMLEKNPAPEAKIELTAAIDKLEWVVVHPLENPQ